MADEVWAGAVACVKSWDEEVGSDILNTIRNGSTDQAQVRAAISALESAVRAGKGDEGHAEEADRRLGQLRRSLVTAPQPPGGGRDKSTPSAPSR